MLKIRTVMLPVVLALILTPVFLFVSAGTEVTSNTSKDPASVISSKGESTYPLEVPGPSYPTKLVKCVDMPGVAASVVACLNPSQIPARPEVPGSSYPTKLVKCVDMPGVVASAVACPNPSQIPARSEAAGLFYPSNFYECIDMPDVVARIDCLS